MGWHPLSRKKKLSRSRHLFPVLPKHPALFLPPILNFPPSFSCLSFLSCHLYHIYLYINERERERERDGGSQNVTRARAPMFSFIFHLQIAGKQGEKLLWEFFSAFPPANFPVDRKKGKLQNLQSGKSL